MKKRVNSFDEKNSNQEDAIAFDEKKKVKTDDVSTDFSESHDITDSENDIAPLESLLYDDESPIYESETAEETLEFENFLNEYKAHISKSVRRTEENKYNDSTNIKEETVKNVSPDEPTITSDTKKEVKKEIDNEWDDEITLAPETYESEDEEENIFRDSPLPEEEPEEIEFSIGTEIYPEESDEIQLSIKFDESVEENRELRNKSENTEYKYNPDKPRIIDNIYDFLELFVITLVCVMILTTFFFRHSVVEGRSMQSTLSEGDSLLITDLFYTPKRGDIVVFEDYSTSLKKAVVKRVIGLPGEKVEVKVNKNGDFEVYINDVLLPEEYALNTKDQLPEGTGIWYIEEGEVFVMGDNRYHSTDSRNSGVGPIDIDCILGKVVLRFYPFDKFGTVE